MRLYKINRHEKILFLFILCTGAYQVKAQQLFQAKPADSLSKNLLDNYLKTKPGNEWQSLKPRLNLNETLSALNTKKFTLHEEAFYSRLPAAVLEGYSKMPIVNLSGYSKMPVKRIGANPFSPGLTPHLMPAITIPGKDVPPLGE